MRLYVRHINLDALFQKGHFYFEVEDDDNKFY
jgi:hypothetical protein